MKTYHHPLYKSILAELRKALQDGKYTQLKIGERLGINQSSVSMLLSGRTRMTIDQILDLCDMAGLRLQNLARQAEISIAQNVAMTPAVESTMSRSDLHILCYAAATQEIKATNIKLRGVTSQSIQICLDDLVEVGVLKKSGKVGYIQSNPNVTLTPSHRVKSTKLHMKIVQKTVERHNERLESGVFTTPKFNWYELDRFTTAQVKEIESGLWQLYEKIHSFQIQNQSKTYTSDEPMLLWNFHMMMFPATDEPHV